MNGQLVWATLMVHSYGLLVWAAFMCHFCGPLLWANRVVREEDTDITEKNIKRENRKFSICLVGR